MAKVVSNIGTDNISIGATMAMVATDFITHSMVMAADIKPKNKAQVAPIKVLDGLKL